MPNLFRNATRTRSEIHVRDIPHPIAARSRAGSGPSPPPAKPGLRGCICLAWKFCCRRPGEAAPGARPTVPGCLRRGRAGFRCPPSCRGPSRRPDGRRPRSHGRRGRPAGGGTSGRAVAGIELVGRFALVRGNRNAQHAPTPNGPGYQHCLANSASSSRTFWRGLILPTTCFPSRRFQPGPPHRTE